MKMFTFCAQLVYYFITERFEFHYTSLFLVYASYTFYILVSALSQERSSMSPMKYSTMRTLQKLLSYKSRA